MGLITHFLDLKLKTVSLEGVKQVYHERLKFPIKEKTENQLIFQLTPYTSLTFEESYAPISPAHFALQVPYTEFYEVADFIQESGLLTVKYPDGHIIDDTNGRLNMYFRDGDGNLLEIIAHDYIAEEIILISPPMFVMYLREVGLPVSNVPDFRKWMQDQLGMKPVFGSNKDVFSFVIGGTAHTVVVSKNRPWIPIGMKALKPDMDLTFGCSSKLFMRDLKTRLGKMASFSDDEEILIHQEYPIFIRHTPNMSPDIIKKLNLPGGF